MSKVIPLGSAAKETEVLADRKKCRKYDQCGLGDKYIYIGSTFHPRQYYIPYGEVKRVYKRVAASNLAGKGFLAPILYLVFEYGDGQEKVCSFRYLQDCDKMQNELEKMHPEISQMSPKGEERAKEREEISRKMAENELSDTARESQKKLEEARWQVHKRPGLYENLAAMAKLKRHADLARPWVRNTALAVLIAGALVMAAGFYLMLEAGRTVQGIVVALVGIMLMFVMVNSRALPSKINNRKKRNREYEAAVADMERSLRAYPDFPLPPCYAHPVVCDRCIRIIQEMRAETVDEALSDLKDDLKKMDNTVVLSKDDYEEVVAIKPLFTVRNYE
jgi:hypothetical protein